MTLICPFFKEPTWALSAGRWFVFERYYLNSKPTWLVKVSFRYLKTQRDLQINPNKDSTGYSIGHF